MLWRESVCPSQNDRVVRIRHSLIGICIPLPEFTFIGGVSDLGMLSIGAGFVSSKIPLIILHALSGIAARMTIPSALTLLVNLFNERTEQARAISEFGVCGLRRSPPSSR